MDNLRIDNKYELIAVDEQDNVKLLVAEAYDAEWRVVHLDRNEAQQLRDWLDQWLFENRSET